MMVALQLGERIEFLVLIVVSWLLSFTISQLSHPEEEIQEEEEQGRLVRRPQAGSSLRRGNARLTLMNERAERVLRPRLQRLIEDEQATPRDRLPSG